MAYINLPAIGSAGGVFGILVLGFIVTYAAGMNISWVFGLGILVFVVAGAVALVGRSYR